MPSWPRSRSVSSAIAWSLISIGCTSLLGIDGDYDLRDGAGTGGKRGGTGGRFEPDAGESEAGGALPTAGRGGAADAGATGSGGSRSDAGACEVACAPGEKCCAGHCVPPSPLTGCSPTSCEPCTQLPDHATGLCNGTACGFACIASYSVSGDHCVADADADVGAGGKASVPACDPKTCPACIGGPIYSACCQNDNKCGCAFPAAPCFPSP